MALPLPRRHALEVYVAAAEAILACQGGPAAFDALMVQP
jgi:hypothetical protein